ncbi:hypothetical protein LTR28_004048 [Elasticomyces elasticus]|nr:hypothetical protein LTR28_004048 [Elasticomyces elasticus]
MDAIPSSLVATRTWLPGNETVNLPSAVPEFWNGNKLTWSLLARVDGTTYNLFGVPNPAGGVRPGSVISGTYTSTHTTFVVTAGSASFILDFFTPVSPKDYVRQSLPFSYLTVSTSGSGGATPNVQVYSDIDNSWTGKAGNDLVTTWNYSVSVEASSVFTLTGVNPILYNETDDRATWGTAVYSTRPNASNLTAQTGEMGAVRAGFQANGYLTGDLPAWSAGGVTAYSQDLGTVGGSDAPKNITFVIGYVREQSVNYLGSARTNYWRTTCLDINCGCVHMLDDFHAADAEARTLDANMANKAGAAGGSNYTDILALSVRQAFGAIDITIPMATLDTNDVMVFMKEISSDGNVNTVDVMYPTSPIFWVFAPEYIRLSLEPVVQYLASGAWPHNFTVHDIGFSYPNATGHNNGTAEEMPLEECGNLIILTYMYQLASGNTSWAVKYTSLLKGYADYLALNGLHPTEQLSTDDGAGPRSNQTGLVIKAAVALNAYGVMTGQTNYSTMGKDFAAALYNNSVGTDPGRTHFTLFEADNPSWTMAFNLYPDVLLGLNTFPPAAYAMQSSFYASVRKQAGVALDSALTWGKTDWMIWAAATAMAPGVENVGVRDMFIDDVSTYLTNGLNAVPFSDRFFVTQNDSTPAGSAFAYRARPVVGGHFGLLALRGANQF